MEILRCAGVSGTSAQQGVSGRIMGVGGDTCAMSIACGPCISSRGAVTDLRNLALLPQPRARLGSM